MTQQLLAFARKQRLDGRTVNATTLISGMHDMIVRVLGEAADIRLAFDDDLPLCRIDPAQAVHRRVGTEVRSRWSPYH
mgnify:CR=1 FL=1